MCSFLISQISYLGLSFLLRNLENSVAKHGTKFPVFFLHKIRTRTSMRNLRQGSLQMNVIYKIPKVQSWGFDSKLEILIKKEKVEQLDFNLY